MIIRVKFTKTGPIRFIGHLDVMRSMQKALRRAGFPLKLSQGFHPHPVMSFAAPLSLGDTSEAEYMDVELADPGPDDKGLTLSCEKMLSALAEQMPEGIDILDLRILPDGARNVMAATCAMESRVFFREGMAPWEQADGMAIFASSEAFYGGLKDFLGQECVMVRKEGKKGATESDIKPLIRNWEIEDGALHITAGAFGRFVNPKLLITAYCRSCGLETDIIRVGLHRIELYYEDGEGRLLPLSEAGSFV